MPPADAVIENPIINKPFEEPKRHFKFGDDGITDEVVSERHKFVLCSNCSWKNSSKQLSIAFDEWSEKSY